MTRHIDAEVLARYRSGDLSDRRSHAVQAHLAGCHRCTAASADLAEVSHLLRGAAAPPMPTDITARIETALAAESAHRARTAAGEGHLRDGQLAAAGTGRRRGGTRHPAGPARVPAGGRAGPGWRAGWPALRSPVALRVLAGAAAVAVIVGGAYTAGQLAGGTSGSAASSAQAGGEAAAPAAGKSSDSLMAPNATRSRPAPQASPRAPGAAGSGAGAASSGTGPTLKYQATGGAGTFIPVAAGGDFGSHGLGSAVRDLLQATVGHPAGGPSQGRTTRSFSGIPVTTLEGCVSRVAAGGQVRLVDVDRYQGRKATIIVIAPAGGGRQQIWVVGPGCSGSDPHVITRATLPAAG
jgi:hypothetical protein